ncbi:DUF87 domain-containing protein [Candidatus Marsarchaeota archaeon]|nr:DUF87 domain-containing protein [Candidatus Marsarchaeota archaeon]
MVQYKLPSLGSGLENLKVKMFQKFFNNGNHRVATYEIDMGEAISYASVSGLSISGVNAIPTVHWKQAHGRLALNLLEYSSPHMVISGSSGNGKSTMLKKLIMEFSQRGINILLLDSDSEHRGIIETVGGTIIEPYRNGINIFSLDGKSAGERIQELTNLLSGLFGLGYVQANLLHSCLKYTYKKTGMRSMEQRRLERTPCFADLINEVSIFVINSKSSSEKARLVGILNRLLSIKGAFMEDAFDIERLFKGVVSISTNGISNYDARYIIIHEVLSRLYDKMKSMPITHSLSNYIIIDELDFILGDYESGSGIIKKIIREGRKYGLGLIVSSHMSNQLPKDLVENSTVVVTFNSRDPSERRYLGAVMGNGSKQMERFLYGEIENLEKYKFIISCPEFPIPVKGTISKNEAQTLSKNSNIGKVVPYESLSNPVEVASAIKMGFKQSEIDSMTSSGIASKIKDNGGKEWLMLNKKSLSMEHEVNVKAISVWLNDNGVKNYIMDNSKGPDIVAYPFGIRIALEYETGKKSAVSTSEMLKKRLKDYPFVFLRVNSKYYDFYKSAIESDSMLMVPLDSIGNQGLYYV